MRGRQGRAVDRRKDMLIDVGRRARASSACRRRRSPTTWRWSATPPTGSPACRAGAPSRPPRCWTATATSRHIPADGRRLGRGVRSAGKLAATLRDQFELALLFRRIATVEADADVCTVDELEWTGPREGFVELSERSTPSASPNAPSASPNAASPPEAHSGVDRPHGRAE